MSMTGLEVFDTTLQKTNRWLKELNEHLGSDDRHRAYVCLRATLHALRDRLTVEEVAQLGAQLPMLVRGFYYEEWDPTGKPEKVHREAFLARIEEKATTRPDQPIDAERIARAVFSVLESHVSEGAIEDIRRILPGDIDSLWPAVHPRSAQNLSSQIPAQPGEADCS
jgi:uncharacterized protein (DUF2267 family)